ncbi:hypothetical protein BSKO_08466 [Bryopsis sp. KO-2023]|nr:hypothetical protein BSKO_08466 [Bryopsis sp. KO-2023]
MSKTHSNVFIRNLPFTMDPLGLKDLFTSFGTIHSVRILEPQQNGQQRLGFVKFGCLGEATLGIKAMNGCKIDQHVLEVKLADSDVGQKNSKLILGAGIPAKPDLCKVGRKENNNLFVRGFPTYWGEADLAELFFGAGIVVEARVLGIQETGTGGVGFVRFSCVEEARQAIEAYNGQYVSAFGPLEVEFAEDREHEMQQLLTKKFVQARTPSPASSYGLSSTNSLTCSANILGDMDSGCESNNALLMADVLREFSPSPELTVQKQLQDLIGKLSDSLELRKNAASIYVAKLPPDADRLFLYEKFAPFGGVSSVRILFDENRKCTGVGFVNYLDPTCAKRAVTALNGARVAGRNLQVRLQETRRHL